jgi:MoaA/NifB/PqqE/SkfB family radical SAM enzyme
MTATFCPVPWNFQAIQNNGVVRVCCQMNAASTSRGTLRKADGSVYNAAVDDLTEARNASLIKEVRKDMMEGKWHTECVRCMHEEQSGLTSRRKTELTNWPLVRAESVAEYTEEDGTIDTAFPVEYYDLRFGNLCNLACRMCGPTDSHTWYKDHVAVFGPKFDDTHGEVTLTQNDKGRWTTDVYDWHYSENFWNNIENNLLNLRKVYFAGGEPLMIERHYDFLQKCIDADHAKNMIIEYNTNLTNVPAKVLDMWAQFGRVYIGASIDGMGDVLEYQRYPAKWSAIEKNLHVIDQLPGNVRAWIACTVTTYNVWHMPEFIDWIVKQKFQKIGVSNPHKPIMSHHVAHRPWHSNISVIPENIKLQIEEYYKEFDKQMAKDPEFAPLKHYAAQKILNGIVKYMKNHESSQEKLDQFVSTTRAIDQQRNQNVLNIAPIYKDLFDNKDQ